MQEKSNIIILGAGGHAKVVLSSILAMGYAIEGLLDDDSRLWNKKILGYPVLGPITQLNGKPGQSAVMGIGDNVIRKKIVLGYPDVNWQTIIHPTVLKDPSAKIGKGTVIFAGVIIQPDVLVGEHCIINTGATIDHDCILEDYAHLGPGVNLAGGVQIGEGSTMGINSSVIPYKNVGAWSTIGGGSIVVNHLPSHIVALGIPAKQKEILPET